LAANGRTALVLNSGSSSLKFAAFRLGRSKQRCLLSGELDGVGKRDGRLTANDQDGHEFVSGRQFVSDMGAALASVDQLLREQAVPQIDVVGHRIVHGGPDLLEPCVIDARVSRQLKRAISFDPLHTPSALALIEGSRRHFPKALQVACFDTAFHSTLTAVARTLPLPKKLRDVGIRRYGFHGLSCESILAQMPRPWPSRMIVAHLGSGASITAIRNGGSVDTSMGMTSSGGVLMATRTGDLDPGVLVYLLQQKGYTAKRLQRLVNHEAGLLGISGLSNDLRVLHHAAERGHAGAGLAIAMFCASVEKQIAAMISVLRGIDAIVFTGGIGQFDTEVRATICRNLAWAGLRLDSSRNRRGQGQIQGERSSCKLYVLPAQEEQVIARHCARLSA
jgi:acetate kinase